MVSNTCTDKLCTAATVYFLWARWFVHACHYKGFTCSNYKGSGECEQSLVITIPLQNIDWSAFSKACFWGLSDIDKCLGIHGMSSIGLYRQPPCWKSPPDSLIIYKLWIYLNFVTFGVWWGLNLGHFTLKIAEVYCNPPHCCYHYISICDIDKNHLYKMVQAMHYGVSSLIAIK